MGISSLAYKRTIVFFLDFGDFSASGRPDGPYGVYSRHTRWFWCSDGRNRYLGTPKPLRVAKYAMAVSQYIIKQMF